MSKSLIAEFLENLPKNRKIYVVFHNEVYVGSFFQCAFKNRRDAELYIKKIRPVSKQIEYEIDELPLYGDLDE